MKQKADASRSILLTHPERVVYPDGGYTKRDVADYYLAVAARLLPEVIGRPLSLLRCPGGTAAQCFFQKHDAGNLGAHVGSVSLTEKDGDAAPYIVIDDVVGLMELVQMNTLELHVWGARANDPEHPDRIVFDLDPDTQISWSELVAGARALRDALAEFKLASFVRLSGGKGVHLVVPIARGPDWEEVKQFCEAFARLMVARHAERFIASASKTKRHGRIFIDWLRNTRGATSVANWSLRARVGAPAVMPLRWADLARVRGAQAFDLATAKKRAASRAQPWPDFERASKQRLPKLADLDETISSRR